jgi:hypothetical protein
LKIIEGWSLMIFKIIKIFRFNTKMYVLQKYLIWTLLKNKLRFILVTFIYEQKSLSFPLFGKNIFITEINNESSFISISTFKCTKALY